MEKVNIYDAKAHLSKLINDVTTTGEPFLIARNGKVVAKVMAYREEEPRRKLGFLIGKYSCPDNFDDEDEIINRLFEGNNDDELFT
ncbi:type II toxin-antitoxin system Phd/YefM family antitoxin [Photorhabdus cinerea]|uniref:Antitoxin n=1 Tax=Photorhabdus cinerea TaxID=471575 RepID=A0A7X5QB64_9GAMM|nr:type II toxin-antitoxin system Phd/YefM family antitoxin [Photorhabdus cinerea]NHB91139.1 prevent-host-death protein [Photorhabdus cinerea]